MIPASITANFTETFAADFLAQQVPSGFAVKMLFGGLTQSLEIAGAVAGETVEFTVNAAQTADLTPGVYAYQIVAELGTDRRLLSEGRIGVRASINADGGFDNRTLAEQILDAIDALLLGRATTDQQSYTIASGSGSRSLSRIPVSELTVLRKQYASIVASERRRANGDSLFKSHRVKFVQP